MDKALRYLSLAAKSGRIRVGAEDCIQDIRNGRDWLVLTASDASENTVRQMRMLTVQCGMTLVESAYTKNEIAHAIGRAKPVAVAAICDKGLAGAFARAAAKTQEQEERTYESHQIPRA